MQKAKVKSRQEVFVVVDLVVVLAVVVALRAELPFGLKLLSQRFFYGLIGPAKNQKGFSYLDQSTVYKVFSCFDNINLLSLPRRQHLGHFKGGQN